jgi:activator of HSP90 ATPase
MRTIIKQSIVLPASAEELYAMYLDPTRHAAITGAPVIISPESGSRFSAFEGRLGGSMLSVIPPRLVVQSWRSLHFNADDPDSTVILAFVPEGKDGRIDLVHIDVPEQDYQGVTQGWETHYWEPWRRYLAGR